MSLSMESLQDTKPLTPVNGRDITASKCLEIDSKIAIEETENCDPNSTTRVTKPTWTYSKEQLFDVKNSPTAKIWPSELPEKYRTKDGVWDPEMWYYSEESEKRSASPIESKKKFLMDGFVLSPQGRSFARGCQISSDNKHNVVKQNWNNERDGRNKLSGKIGRGWEQRERSGSQKGQRNSPVEKYDRKYKDDKCIGAGKGRRRAESYNSQPEWFTCGTICRTDTMELKGFEEPVKKENTRKKRRKELPENNYEDPTNVMDDEGQFDINQFFDVAENVLPMTEVYEHPIPTSRFSQWFTSGRSRSGSHNSSHNSRRSSFTDELVEIAGLTLGSPLQTPTPPDGDFLFAPIVPASEPYPQDIHQDPEIDVQPLLDSVIPHKTVKGAMNLEDLEGEDVKDSKNMVDIEEQKGGTEAFNKLVETMKASGNLPEKPTPTIPDIPPHLLPRPPSSRDKSRSVSPILSRRSPSPLQLLQNVICNSPVNFVGPVNQTSQVVSPIVPVPTASQAVSDMFPIRGRPLTPDEMYVAPPFTINNAPDLFEFTGSVNTSTNSKLTGYLSKPEMTKSHNVSGTKSTISQSFVPTSVLRKQSEKHDHKATDCEAMYGDSHVVTPQRRPLFDVPNAMRTDNTEEQTLQHDMGTPKVQNKKSSTTDLQQGCLTPHHLPLPTSPVNMTPHSLPLPHTPSVEEPSMMDTKQLLTPRSLPLPESPSVHASCSDNGSFGIKPLPKPIINNQECFRRPNVPRPMSANNLRRYPSHNTQPCFAMGPGMVRRPVVANAYNMNTANLGRVHPTALALALRNQQYQMARAAAVAAATAAVNRAPIMSPAQAAALMLNQQSAAALHGLLPHVNPQWFHRVPFRPNLPPALQHQHHVVHRSEASKSDNSLSKWFSDAVLNQSQTQLPTPSRGAKVLSVEELERHA